jgi:hypothetical protein
MVNAGGRCLVNTMSTAMVNLTGTSHSSSKDAKQSIHVRNGWIDSGKKLWLVISRGLIERGCLFSTESDGQVDMHSMNSMN